MCLMMTRRSSARGPLLTSRSTCSARPADHRQRAADLVRDLRRQHADGDQLLGAHQLVLEIARRRHGARVAQLALEGQGAALLAQDEEPDARDRERRADRRDDDPRQQPGLRDP